MNDSVVLIKAIVDKAVKELKVVAVKNKDDVFWALYLARERLNEYVDETLYDGNLEEE